MKNLLLIPLLLNSQPLQQTQITRDGNHLTIKLEYNDTEYTPFTDNLQNWIEITNGQDWQTTQKFGTQTNYTTQQYAVMEMYNYSYTYYWQYDDETGGGYLGKTFFIQSITPYQTLTNNSMDYKVKFKFNEVYANLRVDVTLWETTNNISRFLNANNWTTRAAIESMINQCKSMTEKTELTSYSEDFTNGAIGVQQGEGYISTQITLDPSQTNYIFGELTLNTISSIEQVYQYYTPTPTSKGLHISESTLTSTIVLAPTQEIVDIPGLMFTILGLPFSFISQAFDLTIFPGTPYQVNFANIFLGFIGIALLLWVLKIIIGQADLGQWLGDHKRMAREERLRDKQHKNNMARETARHNRQLQRDANHDLNRHRELQAKEKADHIRAMQHKGKR